MVVVDPRRSETAQLADRHLFIRPGADAFFLLGLLRTLFDEGLARPGRVAAHVAGIEALRQATVDFSAERVAARCGIAATTIRELRRLGGLLKLVHRESGGAYSRETAAALASLSAAIGRLAVGDGGTS